MYPWSYRLFWEVLASSLLLPLCSGHGGMSGWYLTSQAGLKVAKRQLCPHSFYLQNCQILEVLPQPSAGSESHQPLHSCTHGLCQEWPFSPAALPSSSCSLMLTLWCKKTSPSLTGLAGAHKKDKHVYHNGNKGSKWTLCVTIQEDASISGIDVETDRKEDWTFKGMTLKPQWT